MTSELTLAPTLVAIDTETVAIGPGQICPKLICMSAAAEGGAVALWGNAELDNIEAVFESFLNDRTVRLIFHNAAFDLTVLVKQFPHLISKVFAKLERGEVTDTLIREKLLNLSTHGKLDMLVTPDGGGMPIRYSLAQLVLNYTGMDRMDDKEGDDIWRTNYEALDGLPASDYPREAQVYAKQDAEDTLQVYSHQEGRILSPEGGPGSVRTAEFHTAISFALQLMTCWGFAIDQSAKGEVEEMLARELAPEKLDLLVKAGILTPAKPAQPYANGAKNKDGTPKMRRPTKEKVAKKLLQAHVERVCDEFGLALKITDKGEEQREQALKVHGLLDAKGKRISALGVGVSTDGEVLQKLAPLDPVIAQYQHRQSLQKLVTTYLPALEGAATVHPQFDPLKETGRTSSFASKLYPSCNIQQVDPRVRKCYVPRPSMLLCSVDYQAIELASFAQKCYSLFGYSVHRDRINEGVDLHAYLGSQLAVNMNDLFAEEALKRVQGATNPMVAYELFQERKKLPGSADFYKHWRKFAKPVGLGFPGGMGIKTFVTMARSSYGLTEVDEETAERMKEIWLETYPEAREFFQWVKSDCVDPNNLRLEVDLESGVETPQRLYSYISPLGMYRAGATYCAAANGAGLQTPTAEGAKMAVFELARACYEGRGAEGEMLLGCRPVAFVHDEIIVEIPDDTKKHERAFAIANIMVDCMQRVMPDVTIRAEPALMRRWDKSAEAVFDDQGRLQVWQPKEHTNGQQEAQQGQGEEQGQAA